MVIVSYGFELEEDDNLKEAGLVEKNNDDCRIIIRNLNFYYDDFQCLYDINMDISCRKITALIGPSGCGKSTFLRTINRMNDEIKGSRVEGEVLLDGKNIYQNGQDVVELRKQVGMVFQKPNPFSQVNLQ